MLFHLLALAFPLVVAPNYPLPQIAIQLTPACGNRSAQ
jgi:hypothetical protein